MKIITQNIFAQVVTLVAVLCFGINSLFAQELSTTLNSGVTKLEVGQTVSVNLFVDPEGSNSIYTVSANLVYDPEKLEFVSATMAEEWFELSQKDVSITDTINGLIVRTAGYPNGFLGRAKFATYKFRTKQAGETRLLIAAGQAYNDNNANMGVKNSDLSLSIVDGKSEVVPLEKSVDVNIQIKGDNAFYRQEDYTFTVYHKNEEKHQQAITKIWLFDEDWNIFYEDEKLWRTDQDTVLNFVIPGGTVDKEGNFKIIARVRYEDGREFDLTEKDLGILSNGETWFTKHKEWFMPIFFFVVIVSALHHFFVEREVYLHLHKFIIGDLRQKPKRMVGNKKIKSKLSQ
jgi:hypothetical protein